MEARTGQILFINLVEIGHSDLEDLYFSFSSQAGASCSVQFIFWDVVFNVDIKHSCRQWCPDVFAWSLTGISLWIPSFAEQHRVCSAWWQSFFLVIHRAGSSSPRFYQSFHVSLCTQLCTASLGISIRQLQDTFVSPLMSLGAAQTSSEWVCLKPCWI